jgi:hypothetical protein
VADVVAPTDINQGLSSLSSRDGLCTLMRSELELAAEPNASSLSSLAAFVGPGANEPPFKFR